MALRIHFEADDLLRTRFAATLAPLMELGLALAAMRRQGRLFASWRTEVAGRLPREAGPMLHLIPANGAGPVFLDPVSDGVADGLDTVLRTPPALVRGELRRVFADRRQVVPWVRLLDRGDRDAWRTLETALRLSHEAVIGPDTERLRAAHRAEVALRAQMVAARGLADALAAVWPGAGWITTDQDAGRSTLALPSPSDRDLHLGGRGLTLQPSAYHRGPPLYCDHPDGSLLLVYRAAAPLPLVSADAGHDALGTLLGDTRAAALERIGATCSTTELARDLGVSAATASEHAKTLRTAGLVDTVRDGRAVRHAITGLGAALLDATRTPSPRRAEPALRPAQ